MATKPKTYYEKVVARRRNSDILKLQETYSRAVEDYGVATAQKQTEYEKQMADYSQMFGTYEQKYSSFKARADDYNRRLELFNTKTAIPGDIGQLYGKDYYYTAGYYSGKNYVAGKPLPREATRYIGATGFVLNPGYEFVPTEFGKGGMKGYVQKRGGADPGEFTEKFEETPPDAPAAMDLTAEKAKLEFEKSTMEREIDERAKARLRAAKRGSDRPMLSAGVSVASTENPNG
jgi:hypothetical protein